MAQRETTIVSAFKAGHPSTISLEDVRDVVHTHEANGLNYVWLAPKYGRVLWIDYDEPAGSNNWKTYSTYWFGRHGALVSHDPKTLVKDHVKWYVGPKKRIDLRFYFASPRNGDVYVTSPTREFYELEAEFFHRHGFCEKKMQETASAIMNRNDKELSSMKGLAPYWPPWFVDRPILESPEQKDIPNITKDKNEKMDKKK